MRWGSQFAARPMKIRPPLTVGDDQLKYSASPDAVAGPIARDQRWAPVTASRAYRECAPAAYTVSAPVTGSASTAGVPMLPFAGQNVLEPLSSCFCHRRAPVMAFTA